MQYYIIDVYTPIKVSDKMHTLTLILGEKDQSH